MGALSQSLSGTRAVLSSIEPSRFGLAAQFCWWQWFMGALEVLTPSFIAWCPRPLTGMQGTAILVVSVLLALRGASILAGKAVDRAAIVCLMGASALVAFGGARDDSPVLLFAALVLAGIGIAWSYTRWSTIYCRMDGASVFTSAFGAFILAAPVKIALSAVSPLAATIVACLLPIISFQCAWRMEARLPEEPSPTRLVAPARKTCIAKILTCVVSFSLIEATVPTILGLRVSDFSGNHFIVSQLVAAGLAAAILLWLHLSRDESNFGWVWRCILVWMGVLLFLVTFGQDAGLYATILYGSFSTIWLFLWVILIDISRYSPLESVAFVGLGSALSWIPYSASSMIIQRLDIATLDPSVSFFIFLALVAVMILCTDTRDPDIRIVLSAMDDKQWRPADWQSIDERCQTIAEQYGLTKRETEVMTYVVKGRSRTYIAETLFVSENTVKAHTKHLYAKLGIKNRQELQSFLGMD